MKRAFSRGARGVSPRMKRAFSRGARGVPSHEESLQPGSARGVPSHEESLQPGSARGVPSHEDYQGPKRPADTRRFGCEGTPGACRLQRRRHGTSARAPAKSLEVHPAVFEHHAFRLQQGLLSNRISDGDASSRVDDTMPGQFRSCGESRQRLPHLARAAGQSGEFGDLAVGHHGAAGNLRDDLPDTLAKVYACIGRLVAGSVHGQVVAGFRTHAAG